MLTWARQLVDYEAGVGTVAEKRDGRRDPPPSQHACRVVLVPVSLARSRDVVVRFDALLRTGLLLPPAVGFSLGKLAALLEKETSRSRRGGRGTRRAGRRLTVLRQRLKSGAE